MAEEPDGSAAVEVATGGELAGRSSGEDDKMSRVVDDGDRSFGGNRWPREETVALINIRSEMDAAFRESSSKGPLWEEISRKLAELGYNRSAKKCKEKFENVFKYHKRTKDGRGGKQDGKTYRFFQQLEALEHHHPAAPPPPPPSNPLPTHHVTVPSTTITATAPVVNPIIIPPAPPSTSNVNPTLTTTNGPQNVMLSSSFPNISSDFVSNSSSSTSSDEDLGRRVSKKRKWKDFFHRLMNEVVEKQEQMQKRFLETIEKREQERVAREESWRMQEMMKIHREREILAQERSMAAAKDAAVLAFLQKISEQQNVPMPPPPPAPASQTPQQPPTVSSSVPSPLPPPQQPIVNFGFVKPDHNVNGGNNSNSNSNSHHLHHNLPSTTSSSRWPKAEVEALIQLRKNLDTKYNESAPKGPLWEEISAGMRRLGYDRSAKRCKEKWENINKYFKKVKESNRKRPEDSKTCPYFHQLDALYRERNKMENVSNNSHNNQIITPENTVPLMVRPEQQWPPSAMKEVDSEQTDQNHDDDQDDEDEEDDDASDHFEVVAANRLPSVDQRVEN